MNLHEIITERLSGRITAFKAGKCEGHELLSDVRREVILELLNEREAVLNTLQLVSDTERDRKDNIDRLRDDFKILTGGTPFDFKGVGGTQNFITINKKIKEACSMLNNRILLFRKFTEKHAV